MKRLLFLILSMFLLCQLHARTSGWQSDWYASVRMAGGTGEYLPFWARTGEDGTLPVRSSALLTAGTDFSYHSNKGFFFDAGANLACAYAMKSVLNPKSAYGLVDRAYVSAGWKMLRADIGLKPRHGDLGGLSITGGDVMMSGNARNLPGINLTADWIYADKGRWFAFKGNIAHYHMADNRCVPGTMLHDKSVAVRIAAGRTVEFMAGFHHYAQWGGVSEVYGAQECTLENYIKTFFALRGGANDSLSDQMNVYGNHLGNEWMRLVFRTKSYSFTFQYDKPFEDNSGMIFRNVPDGVWSVKFSNNARTSFVTDIVCEFIHTTWQSGPLHDRPATEEEMAKQDPADHYYGKIVLGGRDNYFNSGHYTSGWTYHGRAMGLPLLTTYAPDENGRCKGFVNNRVRGYHMGIDGMIARIPYRFKATFTENFGTYGVPFASGLSQLSIALEASLPGDVTGFPVAFTVGAYGDIGELYQKSAGLTLKLTYGKAPSF